jgi:hypothetical protein
MISPRLDTTFTSEVLEPEGSGVTAEAYDVFTSGPVYSLQNLLRRHTYSPCTKSQHWYTASEPFHIRDCKAQRFAGSAVHACNGGANGAQPLFRGSMRSLSHWAGSTIGAMRWGSPFQTRIMDIIRNTVAAELNRDPPIELSVIAPITVKRV